MKKATVSMLAAAAALGLAVPGLLGQAQPAAAAAPTVAPLVGNPCDGPHKSIVYMNMEAAMQSTDEGKAAFAELTNRFAPTTAALKKASDDIAALQKQVDNGANTLTPARRQQLMDEIQRQSRDAKQQQDNANSDYQAAVDEVYKVLAPKMSNVLEQYTEDHCVDAVFDNGLPWPQSPLVSNLGDVDILDAVIKIYNQRYPVAAGKAAPAAGTKPGGGGLE